MCGIFGQSTNTPIKLDVPSVNILGIYNIERGKQSCGLTWDGDIHHGIDKDKLYIDFIKNRQIKPKHFPIIFGHTRQASLGNSITIENAHPFGYGISKDGYSYEFIFVHNGTLKNHKELAKKYNIDTSVKYQKKYANSEETYEATRDKIDSEILGEILWKTKSYHVLSEYVGAAACAWMWCDEPNKLYLWSGASKLHIDDNDGKIYEERPLCVYTRSKNNMFFSSLEDSLTSIGGILSNNIEQITPNHVHIITNGDYKNCEKIKATRINSCQDDSYKITPRHTTSGFNKTQDYYDQFDCRNSTSENIVGLDIQTDTPLNNINNYKGKVYSKSLRYWKNGHVINGIYMYINDYGFKKLGDNYNEAHTSISNKRNVVFENGDWNFNSSEGFIPIKTDTKVQLHYFIDGAMLKNINYYVRAQTLKNNLSSNYKYIPVLTLSNFSKHPIATLVAAHKPNIYFEEKLYTGNCVELGFEKVYYFEDGKFLKWNKRLDLKETPVIQLPMNLNDTKKIEDFNPQVLNESIRKISKYDEEYEKELEEELAESLELEDHKEFIDEFLNESFNSLLVNVNKITLDLLDFKEDSSVKDSLNTLKLIEHTLKDFVTTPKN